MTRWDHGLWCGKNHTKKHLATPLISRAEAEENVLSETVGGRCTHKEQGEAGARASRARDVGAGLPRRGAPTLLAAPVARGACAARAPELRLRGVGGGARARRGVAKQRQGRALAQAGSSRSSRSVRLPARSPGGTSGHVAGGVVGPLRSPANQVVA